MKRSILLKTGFIGTVTAAVCCFTNILVLLLGVLGLSFLTGSLDYVLLPSLAVFLCITVYAYFIKKSG
jgi:mercuric ion transport protein